MEICGKNKEKGRVMASRRVQKASGKRVSDSEWASAKGRVVASGQVKRAGVCG